jgi:hypothetical protein
MMNWFAEQDPPPIIGKIGAAVMGAVVVFMVAWYLVAFFRLFFPPF